ncbi:hypothetical protein PRZ48_010899 [Zasmidium cellare]|uniref:Uncharacterized protein n=1 Tax=Zasmidium cellare TaxID=395010 RepID=A0ABR0E9X7_ZASCE|nr:hypothetical protein PRZ48_010899 [Zasmidium cellare]
MCLVTSPKRSYYVKDRDHYAPRPVSNYHGGPRSSITTSRRYSSSVPAERLRAECAEEQWGGL